MVTQEQLKKLAEPMEYKYRLQSAKYNKATIVSYIDSRAVQDRLDDVCGIQNWQNEFRQIDGSLFCGISVQVDKGDGASEWITKWDVGSESAIEKEKGNSSDSFKRSAVMWGVGRFLYSLGMITLKAKKHTNEKEYPTTDEGNILWTVDELTEYCKKVVASGELDRTKPNVKPLKGAQTTTPQATPKVTPTSQAKQQEVAKDFASSGINTKKPSDALAGKQTTVTNGSALQPSKEFTDDAAKDTALGLFKKLDQPKLLKHLIAVEKLKYTDLNSFIKGETIEKIREIYTRALAIK